eukprot:TRINITY_DN72385_c0_g1_i1.p3 TRINITY_DN72385_c0_g1~~TRINITY_DN72385_c0_g1_i1.p3  ORF type:complete len:175 (-),score=23.33 TRINITY_DN72385_c0_g1_i1:680-1204(-)
MVLGTAVKHFSVNATRTMLIVRRRIIRKEKPSGGYNFLVLFDGSEESKKALSEALKVVDQEKDKVDCVSFDTDGTMGKYKDNVETVFKNAKIAHGEYKAVQCAGEYPTVAIEKYLVSEDTPDYDFVVLGSKGAGIQKRTTANYLGTVAEKVITSARTNLILVVKQRAWINCDLY